VYKTDIKIIMESWLLQLTVLSLLSCFTVGEILELSSMDDLKEFRSQSLPHGIFYYHSLTEEPVQSRTLLIMAQSEESMGADDVFMSLAMINCRAKDIKPLEIDECLQSKRSFFTYMDEKKQRFDLRTLYNVESFLANMLMFVAGDEVGIVQNEKDWEYEQIQAVKNKKDLILSFCTGVGDTNHYHLMTYAVGHQSEYKFAFTTEKAVTTAIGIPEDSIGSITYAKCSQVDAAPCPVDFVSGKTGTAGAIANLVLSQRIPSVSLMKDDGSTLYGDITDLNMLWIFVDNDDDIQNYQTIMISVIEKSVIEGIFLRSVIIDRRKHENKLQEYGVYESTFLPLALMEVAASSKVSKERQLESFPPDSNMEENDIEDFVKEVINSPKTYASTIAENVFPVESVSLTDWEQPTSNSQRKILAHACSADLQYKSLCEESNPVYRRIVRTLVSSSINDVEYFYVDHSGKPKSSAANEIPSMRLYVPGKDELVFHLDGKNSYEKAIVWINEHLSISANLLPVSASDFVSLTMHGDIDVNKENLLGKDDVLAQLEEDEISKDAVEARKKFYEDEVEFLTDKTFNATLKENYFVVVFYYVPWDDRSYLFQTEYAQLHKTIANDKKMNTMKIAKVNCHSEFSTCIQERSFVYPFIKIYKNGLLLADYNGMFDQQSLLKALKLYNQPSLTKLTDDELTGSTPVDILTTYNTIVVVGYFSNEQTEEFKIFEKASKKNYGKFYFLYVSSENGMKIFNFDKDNTVKAYVPGDTWDSERQFHGEFSSLAFDKFLMQAVEPSFGELTPPDFPHYKTLGKSFLLLFTSEEMAYSSEITHALEALYKEKKLNKFSVVYMNTDLAMSKTIRRSYLGQINFSPQELVIVNYDKSDVFAFDQSCVKEGDVLQQKIAQWIENCEVNDVTPTSHLQNPKWKPLREGFDFLHYIKHGVPADPEENEEEEVGNYGHYKPADRAVFHGVKAPKTITKDDAGSYIVTPSGEGAEDESTFVSPSRDEL